MEIGENHNGEEKSKYSYHSFKTAKFSKSSGLKEDSDNVTVEEPMEIRFCHEDGTFDKVAVTMRTPSYDFELAAGFLFTEGIIKRKDDILSISYSEEEEGRGLMNVVNVTVRDGIGYDPAGRRRDFNVNSSCGICGKNEINQVFLKGSKIINSNKKVELSKILQLPSIMLRKQKIFNLTGGIHAAGAFDLNGNLLHIAEDVGRHNAVDKVIGQMLMNDEIPGADKILQISGRAGFEIAQKAVMAGFPVLSSVSAPSSLAVETADTFNMTLVCFVRGDRLNIYSHGERILYP